jgi:hypothetical protein
VSDKPAPSATEMEEAPASAALLLGEDGPDASDPQHEPRRLGALTSWSFEHASEARGDERPVDRQVASGLKIRTP